MSVHYAAQVFRESFLKSAAAGRMGGPSVPLSELCRGAGEYTRRRGGEVRLRASVESLRSVGDSVQVTVAANVLSFDYVVSAVPFDVLAKMLPTDAPNGLPEKLQRFETSPI